MRTCSNSQIAAVLMALFCATNAFASLKAISDEKLIARAELIALVEVESFVKKEDPSNGVVMARAHARIIELQRGPDNLREIDFRVDSGFPCTSVQLEPGLHFVFLKRDKDEWYNPFHSRSFRRVVGDMVRSPEQGQKSLGELVGMIPDAKRMRIEDRAKLLPRPLPSFEIRGPW